MRVGGVPFTGFVQGVGPPPGTITLGTTSTSVLPSPGSSVRVQVDQGETAEDLGRVVQVSWTRLQSLVPSGPEREGRRVPGHKNYLLGRPLGPSSPLSIPFLRGTEVRGLGPPFTDAGSVGQDHHKRDVREAPTRRWGGPGLDRTGRPYVPAAVRNGVSP